MADQELLDEELLDVVVSDLEEVVRVVGVEEVVVGLRLSATGIN